MQKRTNKLTKHLLLIFSKAQVSSQTKVGFDNNTGLYFLWWEAGSFSGHHVASNTEHPLALAACHRMGWMRPLSVYCILQTKKSSKMTKFMSWEGNPERSHTFLVKSQNEKCRQIPSRKFGAPGILQNTVPEIADWKLLIPLGPDHHCRRHNGWGGHHRLGHHSQGQHAQKACPKGQKAGTKGHQLGIWPQRGLRFLVQ